MTDILRTVRVGPAGDSVPEVRKRAGKDFAVTGFRDQHMQPLPLESGPAGKQVTVPDPNNPRSVAFRRIDTDSQAFYPKPTRKSGNLSAKRTEHVQNLVFFAHSPLGKTHFITYISAHIGDVPKLVRGGSAKALFISSSLIVAS